MMELFLLLGLISIIFHSSQAVTFPPSFLEEPPQIIAFVINEAVKLPCRAVGTPSPTYEWYRNDALFDFSANAGRYTKYPGEGTLVNLRPGLDDDGLYQCVARNEYGAAYSVKTVMRKAVLQKFENLNPVKMNVYRGNSAILRCQVPHSYPPPTIRWFSVSDGRTTVIQEDNTRSIDIDGHLYFARVTLEDANVVFQCSAYNSVTRGMTFGPDNTFNLYNSNRDQLYPVTTMYRSPRNMVALRGQKIEFRCIFGGNPPPTIRWEKEGTQSISEIPNIKVVAMGAILEISNASEIHVGKYLCKGENSQTTQPEQVSFDMVLMSAPFWIVKPQDTSVAVGSSFTFVCKAGGDPTPDIIWYINGKSADSSQIPGKRYLSNTRDLVFQSLTLEDSVVVQCNATNKFGYVFADAYLNVLREPPTFTVPPQKNLKMSEDQSVNITCQTFSAPPAIITWSRNDKVLTGGRYRLQDNGDLFIENLMTTDTGSYTCKARNIFGEREVTGDLTVRRKTFIVVPPYDIRVYEGQEVKFVCTAITDPLELDKLVIVWSKDGTPLDSNENPRVRTNLQDNSLIISGATPQDTGQYECRATNQLDSDARIAQLVVQGRPEKATSVVADCSSQTGYAIVTWQPGSDNYAPALKYTVEFSTQWQRNTWFTAVDIEGQSSTNPSQLDTSTKVTMRPFIQYLFRIVTRNIVGRSEPSDISVLINDECQLPAAKPSANPTNVWLEGDRPQHLVIRWTPISILNYNGKDIAYSIETSCMNCPLAPLNVWNTTTVSNRLQERVDYTTIIFNNLQFQIDIYKKYKVRITARNEAGLCAQPAAEAVGFSGEDVPRVTPSGLNKVSDSDIRADAINLVWNEPASVNDEDLMRGFFRGYRIEWCIASLTSSQCDRTKRFQDVIINVPIGPSSTSSGSTRRKRQATKTRTAWLTNLPGATLIRAWVRVINKRYAGPASNTVEVATLEGTPGPVGDFALSVTGVNNLDFVWNKPTQINGQLIGYQLGYREINGLDLGHMAWAPQINDPLLISSSVSGLKPSTNYRVYLWALTAQGKGDSQFLDVRTAPADTAPDQPTFAIEAANATSFIVNFAPSSTGISGSVFYVQYRLPGRGKWEETQREYQRRWIVIMNLSNDTWYEVRVVATNGASMSTYSRTVKVKTGGPSGPNVMQGASATWFIIMLILLICMIGGLAALCFVRQKRILYFKGEQVSGDRKISTGGYNPQDVNTYKWNQQAPGIGLPEPISEPNLYGAYPSADYRDDGKASSVGYDSRKAVEDPYITPEKYQEAMNAHAGNKQDYAEDYAGYYAGAANRQISPGSGYASPSVRSGQIDGSSSFV